MYAGMNVSNEGRACSGRIQCAVLSPRRAFGSAAVRLLHEVDHDLLPFKLHQRIGSLTRPVVSSTAIPRAAR